MNKMKQKIEVFKKRIKIALKCKNIYSFIMRKVTLINNILTIKYAIEDAWEKKKKL